MNVPFSSRYRQPPRTGVTALLDQDPATRDWLAGLEAVGAPDFEVALPAACELAPLLLWLAAPHEDIEELLALRPCRDRDPEVWWLLERTVHAVYRATGSTDEALRLPPLPAELGPAGRYFPVYVYLAAVPHTLRLHRERGVDGEVSRLTLSDLGRHMARYRRKFGTGGVEHSSWLTRHLRGELFQLGRLQFERVRLGAKMAAAIRACGVPRQADDLALSVHIPAMYGPMSPDACDASFTQARAFFARHFPGDRFDVAICQSWLLDPQLAEYLSPESNILRFQQRFRMGRRWEDNDEQVQDFVFGRVYPSVDQMPARTTLERAIVAHARSGRHWRGASGWLPLDAQRP